jgi:hypothetical protein
VRIAEGYAEIGQKKNLAASQYRSRLNFPAMQKPQGEAPENGFT